MGIEFAAEDAGLLLIRVITGLLFAGHGAQKVFGWFGGDGLATTGEQMEGLGYRKGWLMALVAGLVEIGVGVGLALGVATPLVAAGIIGTMLNATLVVHVGSGLWNQNGGYEYPLVLGAIAAGIAIHGPGTLSGDALLGMELNGLGWGIGAVILGIVAAAGILATRRRQPAEPATVD